MYKLIQRNTKKLMAVFAAALMVAFVAQTSMSPGGGRFDGAFGKIGKRTVTRNEVARARDQWQLLGAPGISPEMKDHPEIYYLLQQRAEAEGISIPQERINLFVSQRFPASRTRAQEEELKVAARGFLLIEGYVERIRSNVKVSEPEVTRALSQLQQISLNIAEVRGDEMKPQTPVTDQDLKAHFDKVMAQTSTQSAATQPLSLPFDYEYPDRVKYEVLSFGPKELREIVRKQQTDNAWEVAARKYYRHHAGDFIPASKPAASKPAASKPATSQPATTFEDVKDQVIAKVMEPAVANLSFELTGEVATKLADGAAAANYKTFAYLESLATELEKTHHVRPTIESKTNVWTDVKTLSQVEGLGSASAGDQSIEDIAYQVEPLAGPSVKKALKLFQFTPPLRKPDGTVYFVRITEAEKAHYPKDFHEIRQRLEQDVLTLRGYEKAKTIAAELQGSASTQGLAKAVKEYNLHVITTGYFTGDILSGSSAFKMIPGYFTDTSTKFAVVQRGLGLLAEATADRPHPCARVEVPSQRTFVVMELASIASQYQGDLAYRARTQVAAVLEQQKAQALIEQMFKYDSLKKQLDFHPAGEHD